MLALRCLHPPSGAVTLTAVLCGPAIHAEGYHFLLAPVGINSVLLLSVAILFNNLTRHRYPHASSKAHSNTHRTEDQTTSLAATALTRRQGATCGRSNANQGRAGQCPRACWRPPEAPVRPQEWKVTGRQRKAISRTRHQAATRTIERPARPWACALNAPAGLVNVPEINKCCACCGLPLAPLPGTQASEVIEIEVKAYRRIIQRKRYQPTCLCCALPSIVTAPVPPKIIPKGKYGISVWTEFIVNKFLYARPTHRLLQSWQALGLPVAQGTVTGGFAYLAPLFVLLVQAFRDRQHSDTHWHADETGWKVFEHVEGKKTNRWYLWGYQSRSVMYFDLEPSRAAMKQAFLCAVKWTQRSRHSFPEFKLRSWYHPQLNSAALFFLLFILQPKWESPQSAPGKAGFGAEPQGPSPDCMASHYVAATASSVLAQYLSTIMAPPPTPRR